MTAFSSTPQHKAIRRRLVQAGDITDAVAIATATLGTWRQVAERLAPIIGAGGVDVLFRRSLHLTSLTFAWLQVTAEEPDGAVLLASLEACLAGAETEASSEAAQALLGTFYELLASMLGESLTERLLDPVWTPESPGDAQESTR